MRFVHVEDFIHPDAGYQLNLLSRLQVKQGHEVIIVCGELDKIPERLTTFFGKDNIEEKDRKFEVNAGVQIIRLPLYGFYSGRAIYKPGLHKFLKSLKPDVLFVHGDDTLTGMGLILNYKKLNLPIVLDNHMLEMASKNRLSNLFRYFYRKLITPVILKNDIPLIRIVDSDFVEKHYNIPLSRTRLLSFGTDTDLFSPNELAKKVFRKEHGIAADDFVVLYAGKLDDQKGGEFLAESLKERISLRERKIVFLIIGNTSGDYGKGVEHILMESKNSIIRFPTQTYSNLNKFYQSADIAIFPKQCSMSFFEVQSCGLPVILEENEINVQRTVFANGVIFKLNSKESLRESIIRFGDMNQSEFEKYKFNSREYIVKNYNYVPIAQQFSDVMIEEFNRFHKL